MGAAIQGRGPAQGGADWDQLRAAPNQGPRAALQPGHGLRTSPPQASIMGTASTTGAVAPAAPPGSRCLAGTCEITWLSPGEKLRSQVETGQLKTDKLGLDAEKAGVPDPPGSQGDTRGGDTWGDTQCLQGDTQGNTQAAHRVTSRVPTG